MNTEIKQLHIEQIRQIQLRILLEVADFCDKNNITYFLTAGTLIGALRHKGFIPWDDDIDLVMLRPDYERFISCFNKRAEQSQIKVVSSADKNYPYSFAKVMDGNTIFIESKVLFDQFPLGINIDIFPLDFLTDDFHAACKWINHMYRYSGLLAIKQISLDKSRPWYKQYAIYILQTVLRLIPTGWLVHRINLLAQQYGSQANSKYIGQIVLRAKREREIIRREWFSSCISVDFEGHKFAAPIGYDNYLKRLFGNYMQLPPKEKRISHHYFKAYYKGDYL